MKYFELNTACGVDTGPSLFIVTQVKVIEAGTRAWSMSSCSVNVKVLFIYSLVHFTNIRQVLVAPKVCSDFSVRCYRKTQYLVAD